MTVGSQMSSIMGLNGPEQPELFALELKKLLYFTLFTLASTNINHSAPNLVTIYMTIKSWISSIMGLIESELQVICPIRNAIFDSVYFLASTIFNQSTLNLAKIYITIKSWTNLIMGLIGLEPLELFALKLEKIAIFDCLHSSIYNY